MQLIAMLGIIKESLEPDHARRQSIRPKLSRPLRNQALHCGDEDRLIGQGAAPGVGSLNMPRGDVAQTFHHFFLHSSWLTGSRVAAY
jgi:hypothetical protein